jgi:agmatinase
VRDVYDAWKIGITMHDLPSDILEESKRLRALAEVHINDLNKGSALDTTNPVLHKINEACESLNVFIKSTATNYMKQGKLVGLVGGDHSIPLGFLRALSEKYDRFGILQIDAHADLRKAYEGFAYSHASIMYNALKVPAVNRLVQVGIRDICEEEEKVMQRAMGRVVTFYDDDIKSQQYEGKTWTSICDEIINTLPDLVYISFDIDGLDPKLCPSTGTPVAGGLEFDQAKYLITKLVHSGRKIIGFDLCEVAPGPTEWDANVGARMLYHLCNRMAVSQGRVPHGH